MGRILLAVLLAVVCLSGADKKKKKQPEIRVVETMARRDQQLIALDTRVQNTGDQPIQALILLFDFQAAGGAVISTQKTNIEEPVLEPGAEALVRVQLRDHVRAVRYRLQAVDEAGHDIKVLNAGPFVIE
ncbi:MAG: hypothetical protein ACE15B_06465 [Bryobacteraceae bacterium]